MVIKCIHCNRSDLTLFRQNAKGQAGTWACKEHSQTQPDPVVEEIVNIIEKGNYAASNPL